MVVLPKYLVVKRKDDDLRKSIRLCWISCPRHQKTDSSFLVDTLNDQPGDNSEGLGKVEADVRPYTTLNTIKVVVYRDLVKCA